MKRLLIFHPALAPYRVDFFNALEVNANVELVLFDKNLFNQKFNQEKLVEQLTCKVSYLPFGFRWKDRYFRMGAVMKLLSARPNVVLVSEYGLVPMVMTLCKISSLGSFKLYTMVDDNLQMFNTKSLVKRILRWLFVRIYDGIIVTNDEVANAYQAITPKGRKILYPVVPILHGLKKIRVRSDEVIAKGKAWRAEYAANFKKVLLFVGRLDPEKNVAWLIGQMRGTPDSVGLVLVGAGGQEYSLKMQAQSMGQNKVIFVGRLEGDDVYAMMSMADVLILPSDFEPYGAVVGEALQWGTPCLVADHVGAKSLIKSEKQGAVYKFNDSDSFRAKLEMCLNHERSVCSLCDIELEDVVKRMSEAW